jgi:GDPmannose 4,6-dehydratase
MWRIVQHDTAEDWVLATGKTTTVRHFVELAFAEVGRSIDWQGEGVEETGRCRSTGQTLVASDPRYFRPTEVDLLIGDPTKAKRLLGWQAKVGLGDLVKEMVAEDVKLLGTGPEHKGYLV